MRPPTLGRRAEWPHFIDVVYDCSDPAEDLRRSAAQHWCWRYTRAAWSRRVLQNTSTVRFYFADFRDLIAFKLQSATSNA